MAQTLEHNQVVTQVVPITVPSCDVDVTVIQQLDDEPNDVGGLTAAELKAKFDETNAAVKRYINDELIPAVVGADATEQARAAAEAERVANEIERVSNETTRVNAETTRGNNETARQSAETTRGNNETTRVSNETTRVNAETTRGNNETTRVSNEAARQNNEAARVLAEAARENAETGYVAQCATSAQDAEAWAVGKRGGVNVGEGDPAYHNNALYWKEQAQQAAGGDKLDKTGDGSNVTAAFTAASSRTNIATGEKLSVLFGKIAKWFSDLGSLAFKSTVAKSDLASAVQTSLELADTALQSLPSHNHDASAIDGVSSLDELATALGAARIQTGSYTGTGTYGESNPCSLTFDIAPRFVIVFAVVGSTFPILLVNEYGSATFQGTNNTQTYIKDTATISGNTVSWYGGKADNQLNNSGSKYMYVAFG